MHVAISLDDIVLIELDVRLGVGSATHRLTGLTGLDAILVVELILGHLLQVDFGGHFYRFCRRVYLFERDLTVKRVSLIRRLRTLLSIR